MKKTLLLCVLIMLASAVATLAVFAHLPARIPIHWNVQDAIDGYGPRAWVFFPSLMMVLIMGLWTVLPMLSPRRFTVDAFRATYWHACLMVVGLLGYTQVVVAWGAYTHAMHMHRPVLGGLAVFVALLGNVIGKVKRNFWLGVRTPWSLANDRVWYSTHRVAAKSMVAGGLLTLAAVILDLPGGLGIGLLVASLLIPAVWSLLYYKRLEHSGRLEA
jgi:uncharacterized membrane protein